MMSKLARRLLERQVGHQSYAVRRAQRIAVSGNQYCFIAVGLVDKRVRLAEHIYRARHVQGLDTFIDDDRNSLYRHLLLPLQSEALLCRYRVKGEYLITGSILSP